MENASIHQQTFSNLLQFEIKQAQCLRDLLEQEYQLLQNSTPDLLEQNTEKKQNLILKLEQTVSKHNSLLEKMGYSADLQGVEVYIEGFSDHSQLKELWDNLKILLQACHKQNEINGGVVVLSRRQISNALELLYGLAGGEKTYGPSGESQAAHLPKSLGKA